MNDLFFWKEWPRPDRSIYLTLLVFFSIVLLGYGYLLIQGEETALDWLITSTLDKVEVPLKQVSVGLFEFELSLENYLISQHYQGSGHQINTASGTIFLMIFTFAMVVLITVCTHLKRFWYLIGMASLSFMIVNFRFEQLEILGWIDNTFLIIVLGLILPISYYFHSFNKEVSMTSRFLTFLGLAILLGIAISLLSEKAHPFYVLANYNYTPPVVLSILFIILVSHEIVYLILYIISGSELNTGKGSTKHFSALSIIYLLNVGLLYLRNASIIDWDIIYVNAFALLMISALIGLWGFSKREILYQHVFLFKPVGALFYLTLGLVCFSTIGFHLATNNDPVLETFEDAIVYSHLGFGAMFFIYTLANFINLLGKGLAVYKVAYKEDNMPYLSANIAGLIIAAAFYYLSNQAALQQAIAGYYNGLGSTYIKEGDSFLSEEYYKIGALFGYNNHRSNYSIGEVGFNESDPKKTMEYFKKATLKNPTEFAYVNLANAQRSEGLLFESLFTLKEGLGVFPNSDQIKNNLGLTFKETNILDSAVIYMDSGTSGIWGNRTNQTNIFEILTRNRISLSEDSLETIFRDSEYLPLKSNMLAFSNSTGFWLQISLEEDLIDSVLDIHEFAYIYNYFCSKAGKVTDLELNGLTQLSENPYNLGYQTQFQYLRALLEYSRGNVAAAFRSLDQLQTDPEQKGDYNHVLGVMALEQGSPRLAVDFFSKALTERHKSAEVNLAISLTEARLKGQALNSWSQMWRRDSSALANDLIIALSSPFFLLQSEASEVLKFQALRYRTDLNAEQTNDILNQISSDEMRISALAGLIENSIDKGNYSDAQAKITILKSYANAYDLTDIINELESKCLHYQVIDDVLPIQDLDQSDLIQHHWSLQNDLFFQEIGYKNPFREDDVIIASRYFKEKGAESMDTSYDILLQAIEINPYSIRLLKTYIFRAIETGLGTYADRELEKLRALISEDDYQSFLQEVEVKKAAFEAFTFPEI